jgi:hypothetical protein
LESIELLRQSFQNVGAYITHLDEIRDLIDRLEPDSAGGILKQLENALDDAQTTLRTDIRILINEFKHLSKERRPS